MLFNQPGKRKLTAKGSPWFTSVKQPDTCSRATRKLRQEIPTDRLLFIWKIFPSCEYHYFWSQHYTCLQSAYLSWPPPVPVEHWTCPNHFQYQDREKGCTWTSINQYFIELFTEVGLGGLPPLQRWEPACARAAHQRSHGNRFYLSWGVTAWKSTPGLHSNSEQRCFWKLRLILTIRLYSSPGNSSQHQSSDHTWSLTPAYIMYLMTQVYICYSLLLPPSPILHKLVVSISFFMNTWKKVINSTFMGLYDECVKWHCNPVPGWVLENSFQNSFLLSLQSNTCNILPTTLIKD